jgi:hypothetical protein
MTPGSLFWAGFILNGLHQMAAMLTDVYIWGFLSRMIFLRTAPPGHTSFRRVPIGSNIQRPFTFRNLVRVGIAIPETCRLVFTRQAGDTGAGPAMNGRFQKGQYVFIYPIFEESCLPYEKNI